MSDLSTAAPEGAAPESTPDAGLPPAGSAPEGVTPGAPPASSTPEGAAPAEGAVATAESHGSQAAADAANADAALAGDDVAFDALPPKWQTYVRQLRDENAESRVTAKRYADPMKGLEPHEQEWLLGLAQDLSSPEKQAEAARRMRAVADSLLEGVEPDPEAEKPLTLADLQRIEAERAAEAEQKAAVEAVFTEAKELGYEKDTPDFALLMWLAANAEKPEEAGDLRAAHKRIEDGRRAIIDQWVAEQKAKGGNFPVQAGAGAPPAQRSEPPKDWKEARARAEARAAAAKAALASAGQ